jgi:ComF family protein
MTSALNRMTAPLAGLRHLTRSAQHCLLPPQCALCHTRLFDSHTLCADCWSRLTFIDHPCCNVSGVPLPYDNGTEAVSPAALTRPPPWQRARAATVFDEHSRQLVHALKYRDRHEVGPLMARLMARAGHDLLRDADWLIPVPLYRWRLWSRRFNQSALLAQHIARATPATYRPDVLFRRRATRAQVGLDHAARRRNVRGAFAVDLDAAPDIAGRNIVLIDDVITTGATAAACAKALSKAGAARIDVIVFALVFNPSRNHI